MVSYPVSLYDFDISRIIICSSIAGYFCFLTTQVSILIRLAVFPLCFLPLVRFLLRLHINLQRHSALGTLVHILQLLCKYPSRDTAILGS